MIVPHHVYLALSDLEQKMKELRKEAQRRVEDAIDDANECTFWSGYACGLTDALELIKETVNHI